MTDDEQHALLAATRALMRPLARLLVARGVPFAAAEESLKTAMVEAGLAAHPDSLPHRAASRVSAATGINRREVTRLVRAEEGAAAPPRRSVASDVFTRWRTSGEYLDARGRPRVLPRHGPAPSFEALARGVTQDVHPRTLLDELVRLGVATVDAGRDTVALLFAAFVPAGDRARMLEFLADNVGDHLSAAVDNVLAPAPRHLERAVFAEEMSPESVAAAQAWVEATWKRLLGELVPLLESLIARDAADPARARERRFRAGLYAYSEIDRAAAPPAHPVPTPAAKKTASTPTKRRGTP